MFMPKIRATLCAMAALALAAPAGGANVHHGADTTVVILMFDGVQIIDFAAPYEVFGQAGFNVHTVSVDGKPVTTAMGLTVEVDHDFAGAPDADVILVPGGDVHTVMRDEPTLAWLRDRSASAGSVLSVCTGASILAEAGLLSGGRATTFHRDFASFEREYPDVILIRDERWVDNGKVVTSAGLASGIDAALHVVAKRLGKRKARSVALHLEYDWAPEQGFVRGLMADRHLRLPEAYLALPEGTVFEPVLAVGDERRWEAEYRVRSPWTPEEFVAHLAEAADADPALEPRAMTAPLATGWHYDSPYGGHWELRVKASPPAADGSYRASMVLEPKR